MESLSLHEIFHVSTQREKLHDHCCALQYFLLSVFDIFRIIIMYCNSYIIMIIIMLVDISMEQFNRKGHVFFLTRRIK